jgi:triosephosphate isomerase
MIITLKINEKSKIGKLLATMIELFSKDKNDVEILITPNFETLQAMEDTVNGKVIRANSAKELIASFKS